MRFTIFALVFITVMAGVNYYIYRRFLRRLTPAFSRYAAVVPIILMLGEVLFVLDIATRWVPDSPALYYTSSAFIGISFMLFVLATVYDLSTAVSRHVPVNQERRRFIKVVFDITMLIAAVSYVGRGFAQGLSDPLINPVKVTLKEGPQGLRIAQLTDVHVGRTIKRAFIKEQVTRINAIRPDLVVITGDLVDLPIEDIRDDLAPLAQLEAPCYFVLGNHEYFHGVEPMLAYVRELGVKPLLNEHVVLEKAGQRFNLVGLTDLMGARIGELPTDVEAAYAGLDEALPTLVLSHQPKSIRLLENRRCDLMLSGHTHGGQIFPFGLLVMVDQPYLAGLYHHNESQQIFVSRGTGYWGPPLRVGSPSEISLIDVDRAGRAYADEGIAGGRIT